MWNPLRRKASPTWTDPLDPHGDGTLRQGDPVFDAVMKGKSVMGHYDPNGTWTFTEREMD